MKHRRPLPVMRLRDVNQAPVQAERDFILYWMIGARRTRWNFALQRACEWARTLSKPLLVFEPLRIDYPWASVRLHRFVLDGMRDQAEFLSARNVTYFPYVEHGPGEGSGLLESLSEHACLIVTDQVPAFFLPRMVQAAARRVACMLECVDGWGLLPLGATEIPYTTAYQFRRFLQGELPAHLQVQPASDPLAGYVQGAARVPASVLERWPAAHAALLQDPEALAELPLDATVPPAPLLGGWRAATRLLRRFIMRGLDAYHRNGNALTEHASSGLSPYLHFGHISPHEILAALAAHEDWSPADVASTRLGRRQGWWRMRPGAEAFLDELVTWRELSANTALYLPGFTEYSSLPEWARQTLKKHARDARPSVYTLAQFERAETHDPLWNAAQRELLHTGTIQRYLRMLWGKLILEWSRSPEEALHIMVQLNNRWALDGRDANSWSGITWVLGRYDRPWPERPIFGKVRSMTSRSTARKLDVRDYLEEYGNPDPYLASFPVGAGSAD